VTFPRDWTGRVIWVADRDVTANLRVKEVKVSEHLHRSRRAVPPDHPREETRRLHTALDIALPPRILARGQRGGILTTAMPASSRTASNEAVNCPARSRTRNRNPAVWSPRSTTRLRASPATEHAAHRDDKPQHGGTLKNHDGKAAVTTHCAEGQGIVGSNPASPTLRIARPAAFFIRASRWHVDHMTPA